MKLGFVIGVFCLVAARPGAAQGVPPTPGHAPAQLSKPSFSLSTFWDHIAPATNAWAKPLRESPDWLTLPEAPVARVRELAEQGRVTAQLRLGYLYLMGSGVEHDDNEAVKWLTRAAEQGVAPSQFLLGEASLRGLGTEENFARGVEWLEKSAEQGFMDAEFLVGLCYLNGGPGVNQAPARGVKWLVRAANQGNSLAQQCAGECYATGNGANSDAVEAARWYQRAADQGLPTAQNLLAGCYLLGRGVVTNAAEAFRWYSQAAQKGLAPAQAALARSYSKGLGVSPNATEAMRWWKQAAETSYPGAQFHLGLGYYSGTGVGQDFEQALACFELDARRQHVGAQLYLGLCYWEGKGTARDEAQAQKWWGEACLQGIVPWRYAAVEEALNDSGEVENWWNAVAQKANPSLQCCLAESYQFGHGVAPDDLQAAAWYQKAAAGGDLVALKRAAWLLATSPNSNVRDGTNAVKYAERAAAATGNKDSGMLDTLAAAQAETGQFEQAIRVEKRAVELAEREQEKRDYEARLKIYETRHPYRSEP